MTILEQLFNLRDSGYAEFQSKLTPGIEKERFIGVRVPEVRKLAKSLVKESYVDEFLNSLPHEYYDENMLHGLLLSEVKNYEACIEYVDRFLPFVDNWAVCDIMSPKIFRKHKTELVEKIRQWVQSEETYTIRFGIEMLMSHFLDEDFKSEYLQIPASVISNEYYVNMMIAWFFATALAKQWDETVKIMTSKKLDAWTHNKTIQKALESYRITEEQKEYLKKLKIKNEKK